MHDHRGAPGTYLGDHAGVDIRSADPFKRYPRMIHMHRWDELSLRWMLDERINTCLTTLLAREPFAVQTMLYFKPAGARPSTAPRSIFPARPAGNVYGCVARP
jgi:hypothetical protein